MVKDVDRNAVNTVLETKTLVTISMVLVTMPVILVTKVLNVHRVSQCRIELVRSHAITFKIVSEILCTKPVKPV